MADEANTGTLPDELKSKQATQTEQLLADVVGKIEKVGASVTDLKESTQKQIAGQAAEIAKLSAAIPEQAASANKRFMALAEGHRANRGSYRGPFNSREEAAEVGNLAIAMLRGDGTALKQMQEAGITPGTGPEGGYLLKDTLLEGILRDVEETGVFEQNCPAQPVTTLKGGGAKRTGGLTVYYPDYGVAGTVSTPALGNTAFDLKRFVVAAEVDNWMLASDLAAALGDFVAQEIAYALALAADTNWFIGDGTSTYCGYTGLFKRTDLLTVTGDSGDDTFAEMIAKSTFYLAEVMGTLPLWGHNSSPKWYMHLLTFFAYLGVRDTAGQPIANILNQPGAPGLYLMGYPVQPVQIAPSTTGVSTVFALFGALSRACGVYRHSKAVALKSTDQLKWLEGVTTFGADVPQDMIVRNGNGIVQLKTAAS